ncbi:MAG: lysylphosphatidylglycerol synthase domain-containing protein [Pseudomonadota bacterium]
MKLWLRGLWVMALALFVGLIVHYGAADIAHGVASAGWGLTVICALRLVPMALRTVAWRAILPRSIDRPFTTLLAYRWYSESVNTLLPVAQVGGVVLRGHLHAQSGVSGPKAMGGVVVDLTAEVIAQTVFAAIALGALMLAYSSDGFAYTVIPALLGFALLVGGFYLAQRSGLFGRVTGALEAMIGQGLGMTAAYALAMDRAVHRLYHRRRPFGRSVGLHLLAWLAGTLEIWVAAALIGHPLSLVDALVLEGLVNAIRAAAFMVPGALGVQEGGMVLLGGLVGLPPDAALSLSLVKRVRELLLGVPGIVVWQRHTAVPLLAAVGR